MILKQVFFFPPVVFDQVIEATRAVMDKLPERPSSSQLAGCLFLQLTVDELGVCIPMNPSQSLLPEGEQVGALVLTIQQMMLRCCNSVSFVSKGKFRSFCLRFEEKFDPCSPVWNPQDTVRLMNSCKYYRYGKTLTLYPVLTNVFLIGIVPEGTYELCSRTVRPIHQGTVECECYTYPKKEI